MSTMAAPVHPAPIHYIDDVFAPVDRDHQLERIGGGFETEVYCTDDHRFVIKLKCGDRHDIDGTLHKTQRMRVVAEEFQRCLGPQHSIANAYVLSEDSLGRVDVLTIQPFIKHARPLHKVDWAAMTAEERDGVAAQLHDILRRALRFYADTGYMPDLYGLTSQTREDRVRLSRPWMLPWHLWHFVTRRNILCSQNLLLTDAPDRRVLLVDYDLVPWPPLLKRIYFAVRWLMCWRDHLLVASMRRRGRA